MRCSTPNRWCSLSRYSRRPDALLGRKLARQRCREGRLVVIPTCDAEFGYLRETLTGIVWDTMPHNVAHTRNATHVTGQVAPRDDERQGGLDDG